MSKKTQTESPAFNSDEFMKLWQDKWAQMMKEGGWPENITMPQMGQNPFSMPFMPGFSGFGIIPDSALQTRIAELEQRISVLEKTMSQRSKAPAKKTPRKG